MWVRPHLEILKNETERCIDGPGYVTMPSKCTNTREDPVTFISFNKSKFCPPIQTCQDNDNDGYGNGSGCAGWDCNDSDPKINPGALEFDSWDGKDNDCDGKTDEGIQTSEQLVNVLTGLYKDIPKFSLSGGVFVLPSAGIGTVTNNKSIAGNGVNATFIDLNGSCLKIGADVEISNMSVLNGGGCGNAGNNGGAFNVEGQQSRLTLKVVSIPHSTGFYGGAIFVGDGADLEATTLTCVENTAQGGDGGCIYANDDAASITITGADISWNGASLNGGGVALIGGSSEFSIRSALMRYNTCGSHGGAIYTETAGKVRNCTLASNTAGGRGGGMASKPPSGSAITLLRSSILYSNKASDQG